MSVFGENLITISKHLESLHESYPEFKFELVIYTGVKDPIRLVTYAKNGYWTHILSEEALKSNAELCTMIDQHVTHAMRALTDKGVPSNVH